MQPQDFEFLARLLKTRSGLALTPDKTYLIETRLGPLARKEGLADAAAVAGRLRMGGQERLAKLVVDAMTTNETFFFRDKTPFDLFEQTILPAMEKARAGQKRLRIWCAACSTGQEPYSLAMILQSRAAQFAGWSFDIVATDICDEVIQKAKDGLYSQFEVQRGLPIQYLMKHFAKEGDQWRLSPAIRAMVQYRTFNLLDGFMALGSFDVVFCRNVLIYFDRDTKAAVMKRIHERLAPDGYLLLGAAETTVGITDIFVPAGNSRGLYVKARTPNAAPARAAG
jgi:chemotaxis protein methyltransferase CheR